MRHRVPVLDFRRFESDRAEFVREVGAAYREYGFCGFSDHTIPADLIENANRVFRHFFRLPEETRQRYRGAPGGQRGYTPFGVEQAKDGRVPDLKEFWHVGREISGENPWPDILQPNVWPAEVPGFRGASLELYDALDHLGQRVLSAIALSLGLPDDWFDDAVKLGNSILRAIHYPPVASSSGSALRAARHEDINLITLLIGSEEAGLEILAREGSWVPVTSIPGVVVVNIGDMMQRLTNHILPSTPHRVVNPAGARTGKPRYSIPFFLHPHPEFLIETLPQCIDRDRPNRYPRPIKANEFLEQRLREIKLM